METLEAIKKRRTIRKFDSKEISDKDLRTILDAGNSSPCAGRLPNWRFIVVKSNSEINKIVKATFNQDWINTSKIILIICSDSEILAPYGNRGEQIYSYQNTAACIENILLAATDLGIGSAWVGAFDDRLVSEILSIPEKIQVHAIVGLGYPKEDPKETGRPNLSDITYFGKWGESKNNY
jgi:nitroreductase